MSLNDMYDYMGIIARDVLHNSGKIKLTIETGSMWPTIKKKEQIIVISKRKKRIKVGDIIVFRQKYGNSILVHRCMFIFKSRGEVFYITKGDAGLNFDPMVCEERVYGVASCENSKFGNFYFKKNTVLTITCVYGCYFAYKDFYVMELYFYKKK